MRFVARTGALLAAAAGTVVTQDSNCYQEQGNWYCSQVEAISYSNFGTAGQYQRVTDMGASGQCSFAAQGYQGGMAPFDGEVSWHFRGPVHLKQFAFYTPGGAGAAKRATPPPLPEWRRGHHHQHQHLHQDRKVDVEGGQQAEEKRDMEEWVTALINGKTVSWINQYRGPAAAATPPNPYPAPAPAPAPASAPPSAPANAPGPPSPPADVPTPPLPSGAVPSPAGGSGSASTSAAGSAAASSAADSGSASVPAAGSAPASSAYSPPAPAASGNAGTGNWGRQAYYNAEQGVADGLVFLNHHGGQGSGVFDTVWGMSLSYASADNSGGVASPVPLADTLIGDNSEFVIMTDRPCVDGDCGTVRGGTVAYHGFDGASKLFLIEFSMPLSGQSGFNADMPAAWILNAQIPRTQQYGSCSCWQTGCGEFDIFEVLDSGNQKCKSTWHGVHSLGDSNWFQRPVSGTQKAAVVLDGSSNTAHIMYLPDGTTFDTSISDSTIAGYLNAITDPTQNIKVALGG